jgi:hypothetical protein
VHTGVPRRIDPACDDVKLEGEKFVPLNRAPGLWMDLKKDLGI